MMSDWIKFSERKPARGRLCLVQDTTNHIYVGMYNPEFLNDFEDRHVGYSLNLCKAPVVYWAYVKVPKPTDGERTGALYDYADRVTEIERDRDELRDVVARLKKEAVANGTKRRRQAAEIARLERERADPEKLESP